MLTRCQTMKKADRRKEWKVGYRYCLVQSVDGPLMNWDEAEWQRMAPVFNKPDGTKFSDGQELKAAFLNLYGEGWRVLPCGTCDNHHKRRGCMGHKNEAS